MLLSWEDCSELQGWPSLEFDILIKCSRVGTFFKQDAFILPGSIYNILAASTNISFKEDGSYVALEQKMF